MNIITFIVSIIFIVMIALIHMIVSLTDTLTKYKANRGHFVLAWLTVHISKVILLKSVGHARDTWITCTGY